MTDVFESEINENFSRNGWTIAKKLESLSDDLDQEDLAQFIKGRIAIDLGFYGDGKFRVLVVQDSEWEDVIAKIETKDPNVISRFLLACPEVFA